MKNLSVLGSTGSIGTNTLNIIKMFPDRFRAVALTAKTNIKILAEQILIFKPDLVAVFDKKGADELKKILPANRNLEILIGQDGYEAAASFYKTDMVIGAMMGAAGLNPVLAAIESGKDIALANKETLVMAGKIVMARAREKKVNIFPVDSEHSAIFQCLQGQRRKDVDKILITASGGPFFKKPASEFKNIKPEHALKHPNWAMGRKITIDSATLMNKGLELIEAKWLFDMPPEKIEIIVHPQSIVHSMVAYKDGSVIAQMGIPDMKEAIAYAISYPERLSIGQPLPDFPAIFNLEFYEPDYEKFKCLSLAFSALKSGGTMPAVMNAANEVAVDAFLNNKISFIAIPEIIHNIMKEHQVIRDPDLTHILDADKWARNIAAEYISG